MMLEKRTTDFIEALSSREPVPGGGGASATVGAFAAALGMMVSNLTIGKKRYAAYEDEIVDVRQNLSKIRDELEQLVDADARAFEPLSKAYSFPALTPEGQKEKEQVMESALNEASIVPEKIMETTLSSMPYLKVLSEKGSTMARSDVGAAVLFAQAAIEGASLNVFINTKMMKDKDRARELNQKAEEMIRRGADWKEEIYTNVLSRIKE